MAVLAIGKDHIAKMIVVHAVTLRTDESDIISPHKDRATTVGFTPE